MENKELKPRQPNQEQASALLEYIGMEDCMTKKIITVISGKKIKRYLKWVDNYAEELNLTQEEALNKIIENK